jgi:hypothetical protein
VAGRRAPVSAHGDSFARGGSLSLELVRNRGGSRSPDFAKGPGQTPMTEDELVVVRPRLRDASSNTSQDGCSSGHGHSGARGSSGRAHDARGGSVLCACLLGGEDADVPLCAGAHDAAERARS